MIDISDIYFRLSRPLWSIDKFIYYYYLVDISNYFTRTPLASGWDY